jgi:hypothetical protein
VPADNTIYDQPGDIGWDERQPLHAIRTALNPGDITGMAPGIAPLPLIRLLRKLKTGKLSHGEFGREAAFTLTKNLRISYLGHALKS